MPTIVHATELFEVYRDDGIVVFDGAVDKAYIHRWVSCLQTKVDQITESTAGDHMLKFTAVLWGEDDGFESDIVDVHVDGVFPFLDMELSWSNAGDLWFQVHLKPHQTLRYLNRFSCHRHSTFADIPKSVFTRQARLTTVTDSNKDERLNDIYPLHAGALRKAGLAPKRFPTLGKAVAMVQARDAELEAAAADTAAPNDDSIATKPERFTPGRDTFGKFGFCRFWSVPIHTKLKQLREKHGLKWLCLRMAYHRYPNVNAWQKR